MLARKILLSNSNLAMRSGPAIQTIATWVGVSLRNVVLASPLIGAEVKRAPQKIVTNYANIGGWMLTRITSKY